LYGDLVRIANYNAYGFSIFSGFPLDQAILRRFLCLHI
jgi:hypothetical protein